MRYNIYPQVGKLDRFFCAVYSILLSGKATQDQPLHCPQLGREISYSVHYIVINTEPMFTLWKLPHPYIILKGRHRKGAFWKSFTCRRPHRQRIWARKWSGMLNSATAIPLQDSPSFSQSIGYVRWTCIKSLTKKRLIKLAPAHLWPVCWWVWDRQIVAVMWRTEHAKRDFAQWKSRAIFPFLQSPLPAYLTTPGATTPQPNLSGWWMLLKVYFSCLLLSGRCVDLGKFLSSDPPGPMCG